MITKRIIILCFSFILVSCCEWFNTCDPPIPVPPVPTVDVFEELTKIASNTVSAYNVPGVIVSIADHDTNKLKDAFYNQAGSNLTSNSVFRVGSVTKMMVAVLLLRLQELQKVNLNDALQVTPYKFTTINLLNHTAGLGDFLGSPLVSSSNLQLVSPFYQWSFAELVSVSVPTTPFVHTYSNTGYLVAGRVAEQVSGQPFNAVLTPQLHGLLNEHIFSKAGMVNSLFNQNTNAIPDMVIGIDGTNFGLVDVTYVHPSVYNSAGAVVSSTTDLHRFLRALFNEELITKGSMDLMMSLNVVSTAQVGRTAGLGVFMETNATIGKKYFHGGTVPGYNCVVAYYEKYNKSIVVATNTNTNGIGTQAVYNALAKAEQLLIYE